MSKNEKGGRLTPFQREIQIQKEEYQAHLESFKEWTAINFDDLSNSGTIIDLENILKSINRLRNSMKILIGLSTVGTVIVAFSQYQAVRGVRVDTELLAISNLIYGIFLLTVIPLVSYILIENIRISDDIYALTSEWKETHPDTILDAGYNQSRGHEYVQKAVLIILQTYQLLLQEKSQLNDVMNSLSDTDLSASDDNHNYDLQDNISLSL